MSKKIDRSCFQLVVAQIISSIPDLDKEEQKQLFHENIKYRDELIKTSFTNLSLFLVERVGAHSAIENIYECANRITILRLSEMLPTDSIETEFIEEIKK